MINVVIPMAGDGSRFLEAGYVDPKPFIMIDGRPMIEWVLNNLKLTNAQYILLVRESHLTTHGQIIENLKTQFNIVVISVSAKTEGAACTILLAKDYIDNETPLLIANCDQLIDASLQDFVDKAQEINALGSLMTFEQLDPTDSKWSYALLDERGFVKETKEKVVISTNASVGIYYYKQGNLYVSAANLMIAANDRTNNEFYICPTYNYLKTSGPVTIWSIRREQMYGLGVPLDLNHFLSIKKVFVIIQGPTTYAKEMIDTYSGDIIWSTWIDEPKHNIDIINQSSFKLILNEHPKHAGYWNINKQILSTYRGIVEIENTRVIPPSSIILKIRSDYVVTNFEKFIKELIKINSSEGLYLLGVDEEYVVHPTQVYVVDGVIGGTLAAMKKYWQPDDSPQSGYPYPEMWLQDRFYKKPSNITWRDYLCEKPILGPVDSCFWRCLKRPKEDLNTAISTLLGKRP